MSSTIYQELGSLINQGTCWECDFCFNETEDPNADRVEVNLADVFKSQKTYHFPQRFKGKEKKDQLIISLQMASIKSGFLLVKSCNKSPKALAPGSFDVYTTLSCQSGLLYRKNSGSKVSEPGKERRTSTRRPIKSENRCPFCFHLKMYKMDHDDKELAGRWMLQPAKGMKFLYAVFV
jgi:hypothetical protein